jgi:hypothetical protein
MGITASNLVIPRSEGDEESAAFLAPTNCRSLVSLGMTILLKFRPEKNLAVYFSKYSFANITVA